MIAWLNMRYTVPERLKAFVAGIERHGYKAEIEFPDRIGPKDCYIGWNRINMGNAVAHRFQEQGLPVIISENSAWGNGFMGCQWYSVARNYHNTADCVPYQGPERWDSMCVYMAPFRTEGETVILPQRGIGSAPTRMPPGWPTDALRRYGGRIRPHPGRRTGPDLVDDLARAGKVVTWGSGAAIKALMMGIPVVSEMPNWIGQQDNTEAGRLEMFRRLAWAQRHLMEISSGEAFDALLT